jgi:hypothetical protein
LIKDENIEAKKELSEAFHRVLEKKFIKWKIFDRTVFNNQTDELNMEELTEKLTRIDTKELNTNKIHLNNSLYSCEECSFIVLIVLSILEYSFYMSKIEELKKSNLKIQSCVEKQKERLNCLTKKSSEIIQEELNYDIKNKLLKNSNLKHDGMNFHVEYLNHIIILH